MPAQYEAIKASLRKKNPQMSEKNLKKHAAMIFNSLPENKAKPLIRYVQAEKK